MISPFTRALLLLTPLALAACAERTEPDPTPTRDGGPYNLVDPVTADSGNAAATVETTPGAWRPDTIDGAQAVVFAPLEGQPAFAMYCDGRRGIVVERRGLLPAGPTQLMRIIVGTVDRRLAVNPIRGETLALRAVLPLNEQVNALLRRGPVAMTIDVGQGEPLRLPPSPLVAMLATDCARA